MNTSLLALIAMLLPSLAIVESNNNDYAIGDNGKAVGRYQIHQICIDDVNRITGGAYVVNDRYDPVKSAEIVSAYLYHYGLQYERQTGKSATIEVLARIYNGGPNGWKKNSTIKYWNKIQEVIK